MIDPQVPSDNNIIEEKPSIYSKFPILKKRLALMIILFVVALILIVPLILFIISSLSNKDISQVEQDIFKPTAPVVQNQLIVEYKDKYTKEQALSLKNKLEKVGVISQEKVFDSDEPRLRNFYLLKFKDGTDPVEVKKELNNFPELESVDVQYKVGPELVPNDPLYTQMWAPTKIDLPNAWNIETGAKSVIVGVVDSGIDYSHPDLAANLVQGTNLAKNSGHAANDPGDDFGHGTHVAGTIGAVGNNGIGVTGNSWNVGIMGIKVGDAAGGSDTGVISQGIVYAAQHGAKVINISMGSVGTAPCQDYVQSAVDQATANGALVVVAAGNSNDDASHFVPASCSGVIAVGATDPSDGRASFSNYGSRVSIAAPGVSILSTFPPGAAVGSGCGDSTFGTASDGYGYCNGTSMASPEVAGVAALLFAINPSLSPSQVKKCIIDNADPISTDKPIGGRRLNAFKALNACSGVAPVTPIPSVGPTATPVVGATATPQPSITLPPSQGSTLEIDVVYDINKNSQQKDPTDLPYAGANIIVTGPVSKNGVTDSKGMFVMTDLPAGQYQVTITIPGLDIAPTTVTISTNSSRILTAFVPAVLLTPTIINQPTPTSIVGQPIQNQPVISKTPKPTPTPATTYSCHMKGSARTGTGAITIGDLVCTPNK